MIEVAVFTYWDLEIMYLELLVGVIVYVVLASYLDRKWKKRGDIE